MLGILSVSGSPGVIHDAPYQMPSRGMGKLSGKLPHITHKKEKVNKITGWDLQAYFYAHYGYHMNVLETSCHSCSTLTGYHVDNN